MPTHEQGGATILSLFRGNGPTPPSGKTPLKREITEFKRFKMFMNVHAGIDITATAAMIFHGVLQCIDWLCACSQIIGEEKAS